MGPKRWIVGITGGIAAYKTCELIRLLKKDGAEVQVVLSEGAEAFVTPMTLQALSGYPVHSRLLDPSFEAAMGHIELARWADGIVIAPLTANRLAALSMGMADDLLTTLCLATRAPIWVAPAMNQQMWQHPSVQHNRAQIERLKVRVISPEWGVQACGETGWGRMAEPETIFEHLCLEPRILEGVKILVTAGPTYEALDPIRFLGNRSSGKMGFALARQAARLGASVTLIAGPVHLKTPANVKRLDILSAQALYTEALAQAPKCDVFISAAAVSDFYAPHPAQDKIKKSQGLSLDLALSPDILKTIAHLETHRPFCVGFSAETSVEGVSIARQKFQDKKLDLIAFNDVSDVSIGIGSDHNALTVITQDRIHSLVRAPKDQIALALLKLIKEAYDAKRANQNIRSPDRERSPTA